jgi:large subunit ribosomal protein L3
MIPGLVGTKIGMTSFVEPGGRVEPVTVVKAGPCVILQVKTKETDGYDAVQIGFDEIKPHRSSKPLIGHCGKAGTGPKRVIREIRLEEAATGLPGDVLTVSEFGEGVEYVDVVGITKGKGYEGVMKRHGFGGMGASHGTERKHRSPGSIGGHAPGATGRSVKKGKRMAGHLGCDRVTISSLKLVKVDPEHDLLVIRGSVPGANGSSVFIRKAKKRGAAK